ncbi:MAG: hydrogenase maturation nickel metallochaperone HypA [Candidatus Bathyarchaeia archaeon]
MHEFSLTAQIVEKVLHEAKKRNAKKVLAIRLVIGKLTFLAKEQIKFAYKLLSEGTILEGSRIYIEEAEGIVKCKNCEFKGKIAYKDDPAYHIAFPIFSCPKCNKSVEVVSGRECLIKSIKILA